jgi:signal transduction histidine kinase
MVLAAAVLMFAAVFVVNQVISDRTEALDVVYAVPVTLAALELGLLGGIAAAMLATVLVGLGALGTQPHMSASALTARGLAFILIGAVAGRFADRMRDAHRRQSLLLTSGLALAQLDVADDLPATVAAQAKELVSARAARVELLDGLAAQVGDTTSHSARDELPIAVRGVEYGTLAVSPGRATTPEDNAMLSILALQAAVAAENRRLLASERERARIRSELQDARVHLAERGHQLRELIVRQEAERYQLAYELNEQAAQSLAAVLLGLAALERELSSGTATPRLGALRTDVDSTLRSLRALAVSLRPPALMLGLQPALERLAERLAGRSFGHVAVDLHGTQKLSEEAEMMVYRVVEEALDAVGPARSVSVGTRADGSELLIDVADAERPIAHQRLAVLRARMELVGGHLASTPTELHVVIPLPANEEQDAALSL